MYSTNIGNNRYYIQCIVVSDKIRPTAFVVDTGARFTCCHYTSVDIDIREKDLRMCEIKLLGGFVKGSPVKFYRYGLK